MEVEFAPRGLAESRRLGRPRDAGLDDAILQSARQQLIDVGYGRTSFDSVAAAAHTTVPAVRRRYRTKVELVAAVIETLRDAPIPAATDSPRADALAILRDFNRTLLRDNALTLVGSLLTEEQRHPELLEQYKTTLVESRRARLRQALAAGVAAGDLPRDFDLDVATAMLIGSFYGRYLTTAGLPATWADQVLKVLWPLPSPGVARNPGARPQLTLTGPHDAPDDPRCERDEPGEDRVGPQREDVAANR